MNRLDQLTFIDRSPIHGNGLYARIPIGKGTIIGTLQGNPVKTDGSYVLWLNENAGFEVSCNLRYINHATDPNACYYDDLTVVALRDIARYEEITHDYGAVDW